MSSSADARAAVLVDTSVAVAVSVLDHPDHATTVAAVAGRPMGLAGHAAFEAFSVLTRLPAPLRRPPPVVARQLASNFPGTRFLGARAAASLLVELAAAGIDGGSVYDALVGATAVEHELVLLTRDRRAVGTYRALGVELEIVG